MQDPNEESETGSLIKIDAGFVLDEALVVYLTWPGKVALSAVSKANRRSMAELVREAVFAYLPDKYPEFASAFLDAARKVP